MRHQNLGPRLATQPTDQRHREAFLRAAEEADGRLPDLVYEVRSKLRVPFAALRLGLRRLFLRGTSVGALLAVLEEHKAEVRSWAGDPTTIPLRTAFEREVEGECQANYWQLAAVVDPTRANLERALEVTVRERLAIEELEAALRRDLLKLDSGSPLRPTTPRRAA